MAMAHVAARAVFRSLRGAVISGDIGTPYLAEIKRLTDILNAFDVPTLLEILPGVGPDDEAAFHDPIRQAIDFIMS